uniref:EcbE n=1 Tax=Pasteurella multocida TaxID=747 RepID=Q9AHM2_PASMD|nr:EcbE [Pasteurella multocida]
MFIIPMAGLSSRFFKAGYNVPKYQLKIGKESVFSWSVSSFKKYFKTDKFIFIYRDIYNTRSFIMSEIDKLGIDNYEIICLPSETLGQADTVYQGIKNIKVDEEIYIFNIDSRISEFIKPVWTDQCDGYLEVFKGNGDHWSFALPENTTNRKVIRTAEKERISDLCSNGLYFFKNKYIYEKLFINSKENNKKLKNEFYIAPLYNDLISQNGIVFYNLIEKDKTFILWNT